MKGCLVTGCDRPHYARGVCSKHYQSYRDEGLLEGLEKVRISGKKCLVEHCDKVSESRGLCSHHYRYYRKKGLLDSLPTSLPRTCATCKKEKHISEFDLDSRGQPRQRCRDCCSIEDMGRSEHLSEADINSRLAGVQELKRTCISCREVKALDQFDRTSDREGYKSRCRDCCSALLTEEGLKKCIKCKEVKVAGQFWCHPLSADGLHPYCKNCILKLGATDYRQARKRAANTRRLRENTANCGITKYDIYDRDGGICWLCFASCSLEDATVEHGVPLARGGEDTFDNARIAHRSCNSRKRTLTTQEYWDTIGFTPPLPEELEILLEQQECFSLTEYVSPGHDACSAEITFMTLPQPSP